MGWMKELGAEVVSDVRDMPTVLVADKLRGTTKMFCALARGIPIVSRRWVKQCNLANTVLDPTGYIIKDKETEKKYGITLQCKLQKASKAPLLSNYKVYATKSCVPPPDKIKEIVECAGGTYLTHIPKTPIENVIIISCPEDKDVLNSAIKRGFMVQSKEFLLTGLFKQYLDFKSYRMQII